MKRTLMIVLILTILASNTLVMAQGDEALYVDASDVIAELSHRVYGANFGPLQVITVDLIEAWQHSGIEFIRFPGGRWGDQNNIREQQVDMLVRQAAMANAEVSIHVRLEGGTPEQAAELVQYTMDEGYDITHWYIGNEPTLFDDYTTEDLNREWRAIAEAMLEVNPDITLIGPDLHQWNGTPSVDPLDPEGRDWMREFLRANGDLVDVVSIHRYPFPENQAYPITPAEDLRANTLEWSETLDNLRAVIEEETGRTDLPVAMAEANSSWAANIGGETSADSHFNAIWWADAFGRLLQDEPYMVGFFDLQSIDARGGWGLLARYDVRPTYYTYQLYKSFGPHVVASSSTIDYFTIYAALRDDGALSLIIVNLNDDAMSAPLILEGFEPGGPAEVYRLDETHNAEQIEAITVEDGMTITAPGRSATLYIVPAAN